MLKNTSLIRLYAACALMITLFSAHADATTSLPDDHAPIGVMGDHNHKQGEWMTAYRYGRMEMSRNDRDMTMGIHRFGVMYGLTDKLTLAGGVPYVIKSMNNANNRGVRFRTKSRGIGDIKFNSLYTLYASVGDEKMHRTRHKVLLGLGVSIPTGSIDERDDTPAGVNQKLGYGMQLGSGTVDPIIGLTYINKHENWSWGAQVKTTMRFGKNNAGYHLGDEYNATTWVARGLNRYVSVSFRLDGKSWRGVHGRDRDLSSMMAIPRGGERVGALVGLNFYQAKGTLVGNRLAIEFGLPIYQNLHDTQLKMNYQLTLGWQLAF